MKGAGPVCTVLDWSDACALGTLPHKIHCTCMLQDICCGYMHDSVNMVRLALNIALNAALKCRPSVTTAAASLVHHCQLQVFAQHAVKKDPSETFCSFDWITCDQQAVEQAHHHQLLQKHPAHPCTRRIV